MQKTILITGGVGFIGSQLADALIDQNNKVICFDNFDTFYPREIKESNIKRALTSPLYTLIEGDVRDQKVLEVIFKDHKIDTVIHMAAKVGVLTSVTNPGEYFDVNVTGTLHLLEAMRKYNVKDLVFTSSSSIYGNNEKIPYSEDDNVDRPISPYAASKKSAELLTYTYHDLHHFNVINLRLFTVFGPRQRPDLVIHRFFKNLYAALPIDIYGDGSTSRDYTYVADIVSGISQAISYLDSNKNTYEIINLGNNTPVKLSELVSQIEGGTEKKFIINKLPLQPGDVNTTYADISKAGKLLGYAPQTTISQGLLKFKKWFESSDR